MGFLSWLSLGRGRKRDEENEDASELSSEWGEGEEEEVVPSEDDGREEDVSGEEGLSSSQMSSSEDGGEQLNGREGRGRRRQVSARQQRSGTESVRLIGQRQQKLENRKRTNGKKTDVQGNARVQKKTGTRGRTRLRATRGMQNRKRNTTAGIARRATPSKKQKKSLAYSGKKRVNSNMKGRRDKRKSGGAYGVHQYDNIDHGDESEVKSAAERVKTTWKVRPLPVDEKVRVFVHGRDDGCAEYDGGEFYTWLVECDAGMADPLEAGAYPLVIQNADLRPLLEIKYPTVRALQAVDGKRNVVARRPRVQEKFGTDGIAVPSWRLLPEEDWPEKHLCREKISLVYRTAGGGAEARVATNGDLTGVAYDASLTKPSLDERTFRPPERAYIRYMQPTPDDLDQSIEYDLDDEDEEWLIRYNRLKRRRSNGKKTTFVLEEEWLEHLMDRMEKEYTSELQRHPETWIVKDVQLVGDGHGRMKDGNGHKGIKDIPGFAPPPVLLPPISDIFPLEKFLKLTDLNQDENVIKDVYMYWKEKHERTGRPLIQRLWYEPPWHRKELPSMGANADGDDVFAGYDVPSTLSRMRKRRLDDEEVQRRFESIRRDLEMARTLSDLVRRREKLKMQEALLLKEEWYCRMRDVAQGESIPMTRGQLRRRPPKVSSIKNASVKGKRIEVLKKKMETQGSGNIGDDRASRLAARRNVRAEAVAAAAAAAAFSSKSESRTDPTKSRKGATKSRKGATKSRKGATKSRKDAIVHGHPRNGSSQRKRNAQTRRPISKNHGQPRSATGQFLSYKTKHAQKSSSAPSQVSSRSSESEDSTTATSSSEAATCDSQSSSRFQVDSTINWS